MKAIGTFVTLFLFLGMTAAVAQPVAGKDWEFGAAVSFQSLRWSDSDYSGSLLNVALRGGYFVFKGLEIEPEFWLTAPDNDYYWGDTGWRANLNLSYNFASSGPLVPFVLAGGGYGNGLPFLGVVQSYDLGDGHLDVWNIGGGGGLKYLIGSVAAVRMDVRFTHFMYKDVFDVSRWANNVEIIIGFSLFF